MSRSSARTLEFHPFFVWHAHSVSGGRDEMNSGARAIPTPFAMLRACHTHRENRKETSAFSTRRVSKVSKCHKVSKCQAPIDPTY